MKKGYCLLIVIAVIFVIIISNLPRSNNSPYNNKLYLGVETGTEYIYSVKIADQGHLFELFGDNWQNNSIAFIPFGAHEEGKKSKIEITNTTCYENLTAIVQYDYWDYISEEVEFGFNKNESRVAICHKPRFYTEKINYPFIFTLAHPFFLCTATRLL